MKNRGTISIKEVHTAEELKQAQKIREEVLEKEQGFPHDVNIDGLDPSAIHALLAKKYRKGREEEFDIVGKSHVEVFYWAMFTR